MAFSKKEREQYNQHREHVGREVGLDKNKYNALRRVAHSLSDADTNYANGTKGNRNHYAEPVYHGNKILNRYDDKEHRGDVNKSFAKAEALRKKLGGKGKGKLHFYHQGDPRGASLYVGKERMNQSNYNSKGHHIY